MRALVCLLAAAFTWNTALGMSHLIVPLYAAHLGFSAVSIGTLFGIPVIMQIVLSLIGGATTDRWGGRRTLAAAAAFITTGAVVLYFSHTYTAMFSAQLCLIFGRGIYWPASETITSQLPGRRNIQFGRLNATVNVGQIGGTAGAGLLLAASNFQVVFLTLAVFGVVALISALSLLQVKSAERTHSVAMFGNLAPVLRNRRVYLGLFCAFVVAQPMSICQSFYPLLLKSLAFNEAQIGPLLALRPVGTALAMLFLARAVGSSNAFTLALVLSGAVAGGLFAAPMFAELFPAALIVFALGMGSALLMLYYQMLCTDATDPSMRGTALAFAGAGWSLSHLCAPMLMGFIIEWRDIATAFSIWGFVLLGLLVALALIKQWAFAVPAPTYGKPGGNGEHK